MNFELGPNVGQFRSCAHPYKINFIFYTCIKPCESLPNTEHRYNFCPFTEIIAKTNDESVFVERWSTGNDFCIRDIRWNIDSDQRFVFGNRSNGQDCR